MLLKHGSLFSGIGGFDLAAEWMGWENSFHCEWNDFAQRVLKYYWPKAISYGDITKTDFTIWRGLIDVLSGGFPCQPYSTAGKRLGKDDERHLWPEMLRAIREIQPRWIVGENVLGLVNWNGGLVFEEVQADLEAQGYEVQPFVLPACAVNAPHRRDRVWFVANAISRRCGKGREFGSMEGVQGGREIDSMSSTQPNPLTTTDTNISGSQRREIKTAWKESANRNNRWQDFPTQSPLCDGNDGLSARLDGITLSKWRQESIKAGGNAVVPQVVYQIFKAIEQYELTQH